MRRFRCAYAARTADSDGRTNSLTGWKEGGPWGLDAWSWEAHEGHALPSRPESSRVRAHGHGLRRRSRPVIAAHRAADRHHRKRKFRSSSSVWSGGQPMGHCGQPMGHCGRPTGQFIKSSIATGRPYCSISSDTASRAGSAHRRRRPMHRVHHHRGSDCHALRPPRALAGPASASTVLAMRISPRPCLALLLVTLLLACGDDGGDDGASAGSSGTSDTTATATSSSTASSSDGPGATNTSNPTAADESSTGSGGIDCSAEGCQCEGLCEGSCELIAGAACEGTCMGTCDGACDMTTPQGECNGTCTGACSGTCLNEQPAACSGTCLGTCYEP